MTVAAAFHGQSLVRVVGQAFLLEPGAAQDLIDFGSVHLDGRRRRDPELRVAAGQRLEVHWPWGGVRRHYRIEPGRLLYRDRYLLAYDKEAGVPTQETPSDAYNNVYQGILRLLQAELGSPAYLALHHRLDRGTSGVLLFSLQRRANRRLGEAFRDHRVKKDYLAWVEGRPAAAHGLIDLDIGRSGGAYRTVAPGAGKPAQTEYQVLREGPTASLVWARPRTGRTHQIRLHLAAIGHPIVGDRRYGAGPAERLLLHAYRLSLEHPIEACRLTLTAPLPPDWDRPLRG